KIKSAAILHTYKQVEVLREKANNGEDVLTAYISYDEKPGIQAIGNVALDLPPVPGVYPSISRDYEYKRYGTLSLLAGIDLLTGELYVRVFDRHRSKEFIEYLKYLDSAFPPGMKLVITLDNHSAHTSKETREYLLTVPNRFSFVFTPTHASWLNIIECLFSKMARSFLRGIRVSSKEELKERILKYIDELNQMPVVSCQQYNVARYI
ncbi:MAG: IS630 family transposase, partial [Methanophagales archaeon]|nr:IS630 family transposase [Methanophagales archaeon]